MRVLVVCHPVPRDIRSFFELKADDYVIGVDQAVLSLYKQRVPVNLAVGDFDSLKNQGILNQLEVVRLQPEKDATDTYQALLEAKKMSPEELYLIGGFGGERVEHFIANFYLFDQFKDLKMIDDYSKIYRLEQGTYDKDYDGYTSIFAYPHAEISLKSFKYELDHYDLKQYDPIGISNETKKDAQIIVHQGSIIVIESKRD